MIKNTNSLDLAAQFAATEILNQHARIPVAESIQLLLGYVVSLEGQDMCRASMSHIEKVLRLVCEAIEPEMAVL